MASFFMHLIIAEKHLKNFKENNNVYFLKGALDPDYLSIAYNADKAALHYGLPHDDKVTPQQNFKNKTFLKNFLKSNKIDTSYNRGHFLHLITDYFFYNKLIDFNKISKLSNKEVSQLCYDDYTKIQAQLVEKYKPSFDWDLESVQFIKEKFLNLKKEGLPYLFDWQDLEKYIKFCSEIDLDDFANKVLNASLNFEF